MGACVDESGPYLSILVYLLGLVFIISSSLGFISLLLLFLHALAFIFLVTRSFILPVFSFSFLGTCRPVQHGQYSVLVMRLSACSPFGLAALFCVAWVGTDASVSIMVFREFCIRASQSPRPLPLHVRGIEERFVSQSLTLLLVGRAGWLHLQRRQNHLPAPPARTAPLRSSPSSALPEDSSHGSRERKNPFQGLCTTIIIQLRGRGARTVAHDPLNSNQRGGK